MAVCNMCGKNDSLFRTEIEGSIIKVCRSCSSYGKILAEVRPPPKIQKKMVQMRNEPEVVQLIVQDFADKIKKKRESLGIKQEDFAKRINEKLSLVHNIETGHTNPSIALARKIGRFLKISLIEEYEEEQGQKVKENSQVMTIGDIIKSKLK
jgi:putative transcription factor